MKIYIPKKQFLTLLKKGVKLPNYIIVRNSINTTSLNHIDGCSSPHEYWEREYTSEPITPRDKMCTCCLRTQTDFVVAHVENANGEKCLYPICDRCNKTYKGNKAVSKWFYAVKSRVKPRHKG